MMMMMLMMMAVHCLELQSALTREQGYLGNTGRYVQMRGMDAWMQGK
jgi:hypothetical protein